MDKWIKKDLKYNWHPYTQMKDCRAFPPVMIEKAGGIKLYDRSGNFYYDTIASWWCNVHGHNHPRIVKAITEQAGRLDHLLFAGFTHRGAILLAERLVSIAPENLKRVFFSDNGSTAVETALKMSFQYWRNIGKKAKTGFIALDAGYHGDTIGAMSVGGVSLFNEIFSSLFFRSFKAPSPYCYRCPMRKTRKSCSVECLGPLEDILKKNSNKVAAIILEPLVMAAGGMIIYPKEYLAGAARLAKKHNVHLIADEVATGFGRTGRMFACEHASVKPDFMCLSKGITSGTLPLGATLTTEKIYRAFYGDYEKKKTFYHGHTYTANPIACAAALASLDIFKEERTLDKVREKAALLRNGLEKFRGLPVVSDVRSIGMIGALELANDKVGRYIYKEGLKRRLILRPLGNITYLFLPLSVDKQELRYILDNTYHIIKSVRK
ncbi:MAG: adenosylmethionine--8-amino-7-oxononanoate transaminase [Candidatus Omnitrophica bacterium]|nr:adenosylmethionine--8-amino-7-oxononanoate transaminase [Candidatus Omnitrophota bacterium]MDD5437185.1 adenosylmethionine--8-amino-7-oxononanoate transaminase [Candidatus Omnitrophota bacterium]